MHLTVSDLQRCSSSDSSFLQPPLSLIRMNEPCSEILHVLRPHMPQTHAGYCSSSRDRPHTVASSRSCPSRPPGCHGRARCALLSSSPIWAHPCPANMGRALACCGSMVQACPCRLDVKSMQMPRCSHPEGQKTSPSLHRWKADV